MMLSQEPRVEQRLSLSKLTIVSASVLGAVAIVLFFFTGFLKSEDSSAAAVQVGVSTSVQASNNPFSSLSSGDSIIIKGQFLVNADYTTHSNNDIVIIVDGSNAELRVYKNRKLELGANSAIILQNGGTLTSTGNCVETAEIYLGGSLVSNCPGTGTSLSFSDINSAGGLNTGSQLPVSWLQVGGVALAKGEAEISWSTASEINNSHFIIQYSENGENWIDAQRVESKAIGGNSTEILEYSVVHLVSSFIPELFYRILQQDFDGTTDHSEVFRVEFKTEDQVTIATLGDNKVKLIMDRDNVTEAIVNVFTKDGQLIQQITVDGSAEVKLPTPGLYIFEVNHGPKTQVIKHIVR